MRPTFALTALLPALALSAPADLADQKKIKPAVTCQSPGNSDWPSTMFKKMFIPDISDCVHAIDQIKNGDTYKQGSTVAAGTCEVEYTSPDDTQGWQLRAAAKSGVVAIIDACEYHQGTYVAAGPDIAVKKPSVSQKDDEQDDQDTPGDNGPIGGK